ncbi:MAG: hypothetical protein ACKO13_17020 [Cytophagales bacterium]
MKKIFYILTILVITVQAFTSCTKEEVKPAIEREQGNDIKE